MFHQVSKKTPHGIRGEGKKRDQVSTCAVERHLEKEGDAQMETQPPGSERFKTCLGHLSLEVPHLKQIPLVGQRTGRINRRTVRSLDSPDECAHPCLRRNRGETKLELHPTLGPFPRLPRQTPQPEPSPIPSLASRYRYTREQGPLWRRATVAAETQSGV